MWGHCCVAEFTLSESLETETQGVLKIGHTFRYFIASLRAISVDSGKLCQAKMFLKLEFLAMQPHLKLLIFISWFSWCLSVLDFWNVNLGVYYKLEKKWISNQIWFFLSSNLIFTACVACKNQFRNQIDFFIF